MTLKEIVLTFPNGDSIDAIEWHPDSDSSKGVGLNIPVVLVSSKDDAEHWSEFAESLSKNRRVVSLRGLSGYQLLQAIWSMGEPVIIISQGADSGDSALQVARIAKGSVVALALVDYTLPVKTGDLMYLDGPIACTVALIRGRQSSISQHDDIVLARQAIGSRCRLIELENCGDRAAESCPDMFEATIHWLLEHEN